jgi:3-hydroxybutyryl-CoA dehydrogenase
VHKVKKQKNAGGQQLTAKSLYKMSDILIEPIEEFGLSKKRTIKTLFSKIGVVGCGKVGQNIARIASAYGIEVVFIELSDEKIEEAYLEISKILDKRIENWGMTQSEKKAILARIKGTLNFGDLVDCDFVIEAIRTESSGRKISSRKEVFRKVEEVVGRDCIIATNSTTIIVTELSSELKYKDRCVSLHFFIQSPEARVCEVVKGLYTSDEVYEKVLKFITLVNRYIIPVEESAGLVSVRLFSALLNEACEALLEGVSSLPDIDKVMRVGFGMRFGPFELADILGIDKVVRWMDNLHHEFGKIKYKASPILMKLVRAKRLGITSGIGFYEYDDNGKMIDNKHLKVFSL